MKKNRKEFEEKERQDSLSELNTNISSLVGIAFSFVGSLVKEQIEEANYDLKEKIFGSVSFLIHSMFVKFL